MSAPLVPATAAVDHLLLGVPDLDQGIAWVRERMGVTAAVGGRHPGVGTRNALIALGGRQYLEIIAPDPQQTTYDFPIDLRVLVAPRLIMWAAATTDITAVAEKARGAGHQVIGPRGGSRARPDGRTLRWKILRVHNDFGGPGVEPFPFFIEWEAAGMHPSHDSPPGCSLLAFAIEHPDPEGLRAALNAFDIDATGQRAPDARLIATLQTPRGTVVLS